MWIFAYTQDDKVLRKSWSSIERALLWLQYQDMNECGLLEIPEAGNWMDLLDVRYNTLYDNVLYYAASLAYEAMSEQMASGEFFQGKCISAECIHERINLLMWIDRCWVASHFAEHLEKLKAIRLEWFMLYHNIGTISSRPYYLPWVAFRDYGDWCDGLANLLAILTGIADGNRISSYLTLYASGWHGRPVPNQGNLPAYLSRGTSLARILSQPKPEPAAAISQWRYLANDRGFSCGCVGPLWLAGGGGASPGITHKLRGARSARQLGFQRVDAWQQWATDGVRAAGMVSRLIPAGGICGPNWEDSLI